jgi:predicted transcriptional regulator
MKDINREIVLNTIKEKKSISTLEIMEFLMTTYDEIVGYLNLLHQNDFIENNEGLFKITDKGERNLLDLK